MILKNLFEYKECLKALIKECLKASKNVISLGKNIEWNSQQIWILKAITKGHFLQKDFKNRLKIWQFTIFFCFR